MKIATLLLAVTILVAPTALFSNPPQKDVPAEVTSAQSALKERGTTWTTQVATGVVIKRRRWNISRKP
jgi:hypothetical protein